jgi:hypothetical protein
MRWTYHIAALPRLRSVKFGGSVTIGGLISPSESFGGRLAEAVLYLSDIDEFGIADFLRHTRNLRSLTHSHKMGGRVVSPWSTLPAESHGPRDWNICNFVTAIGREVGEHLEELSVSIETL